MNVLVSGFTDGKKIQAIKGIRQATGLSLKDSKDVADRVGSGLPTKITLTNLDHEALLDEHGVKYERVPVELALGDFVELLSRYPRDWTIGGVVDILTVAVASHSDRPRTEQT